jgi:hypothetical protein
MKRILVLLALAVTITASEHQAPLPGTALAVTIPDGFVERPGTGAALAWHRPGTSAGLAATLCPVAPGTGPAAFAKERLDELLALGNGVVMVEHRFAFPIGVRTWSMVRYRLRIGQVPWEQVLWMTVDDGRGICLVGSAAPADFARWLPVFERAVAGAGLSRPTLAPR